MLSKAGEGEGDHAKQRRDLQADEPHEPPVERVFEPIKPAVKPAKPFIEAIDRDALLAGLALEMCDALCDASHKYLRRR